MTDLEKKWPLIFKAVRTFPVRNIKRAIKYYDRGGLVSASHYSGFNDESRWLFGAGFLPLAVELRDNYIGLANVNMVYDEAKNRYPQASEPDSGYSIQLRDCSRRTVIDILRVVMKEKTRK